MQLSNNNQKYLSNNNAANIQHPTAMYTKDYIKS